MHFLYKFCMLVKQFKTFIKRLLTSFSFPPFVSVIMKAGSHPLAEWQYITLWCISLTISLPLGCPSPGRVFPLWIFDVTWYPAEIQIFLCSLMPSGHPQMNVSGSLISFGDSSLKSVGTCSTDFSAWNGLIRYSGLMTVPLCFPHRSIYLAA